MTGTTVNGYGFGMNPAANAVVNTKSVTGTTQDFGNILSQTAQSTAQRTVQSTVQSGETFKNQSKTGNIVSQNTNNVKQANDSGKFTKNERTDTKISENTTDKSALNEEPEDEAAVEKIADVLSQIIGQIEEMLGVTDEELLGSMEDIGMDPLDLLDSANMAQLVTAIAGEDSAISLVANEELYTALQDITEMVDTQVGSLLDEAGLTDDELDMILQKLKDLENQNSADLVSDGQEDPILPFGNQEGSVLETAGEAQVHPQKEPVVVKEDNTQSEQTEELPENQQENPTEGSAKVQPQKADEDADDGKNHDNASRSFGQELFPENLDEAVNAAGESVESYTSESTESILRQLADMVKIVRNENLTEMELQLHPASLGTVNVSLTTKGGVVTAEFTTQNEAVKAAIEAQASQLRANLEEQGVKIEAIEVSVASHQMEKNLDGNQQEQQQSGQEQKTNRIQGIRRNSINLNAFEDGDELVEEMQGADDATRIAMEIMAANGNTMDLLV